MANTPSMTPATSKAAHDDVASNLKDRLLGAVAALTQERPEPADLEDIRERLSDIPSADFDRALAALDHKGTIVVDRGVDVTLVKLTSPGMLEDNVAQSLRDRVLGAICSVARGPARIAALADIRSRLGDVNRQDLDRAIVALTIEGDLEIIRGAESRFVRLTEGPDAEFFAQSPRNGFVHRIPFPHQNPVVQSIYGNVDTGAIQTTIERVAHQLWEARGCRIDRTLENWLDAETIVRRRFIAGGGI